MKTVLSVLCCFAMIAMLAGCRNGDDGGSSGGPGDLPTVSFAINTNTDTVTCFNADSSVITTEQKCVWRCAYYLSSPQWVELTFDQGLVCSKTANSTTTSATGVPDTTTTTETETCEEELSLVNTKVKPCYWR